MIERKIKNLIQEIISDGSLLENSAMTEESYEKSFKELTNTYTDELLSLISQHYIPKSELPKEEEVLSKIKKAKQYLAKLKRMKGE
jgi:hypothetical protein